MSGRPDDIVCLEVGSGDAPACLKLRTLLPDDWAALEAEAERGVIQLQVQGEQVAIHGASRVGMVILPSGRRLIIRSKISSLMILEWLVFLGDFPRLTTWLPDAGVSVDDKWHQCIGKLFLAAMEVVTRRHLRRDYTVVRIDEPAIKGRLVTVALASRLHRLPRVPQIQRRRTLDTRFNGVLAMALDRLPYLLTDAPPQQRQRLIHLREQWVSIRRDIDDPLAAVTAAQWASPPGYHVALQLARLILAGARLDPHSNMGGRAFTLSLAVVWERALRRMFDSVAGWRRTADAKRTRRWDDPAGHDDPRRRLTADVIVEQAGFRWLLDAKYKREFGDESRIDRFQMCAYAVAFDADRVSLVYPTATGAMAGRRNLLSVKVGDKPICIESLALPMAAGPDACVTALSAIAAATNAKKAHGAFP
jgi:5-methylcytosine-specific restriction endonuclease McrBC regulatory subunit McrC